MKLTMELKGFEALQKTLETLDSRVHKKVAQAAVTRAIIAGKDAVELAAPVGKEPRSPKSREYGPLAKNIKVQRVKKPLRYQKAARVTTGQAFWGQWYELGNSRQAPRPWFTPAFISAAPKMMEELSAALQDGITKEFVK